jgi:hypothetical protein
MRIYHHRSYERNHEKWHDNKKQWRDAHRDLLNEHERIRKRKNREEKRKAMIYQISYEVSHEGQENIANVLPVEAESEARAIEYAQHVLEEKYPGEEGYVLLECEIVPRMGRPSQGRSYRLQAAITPELAMRLEGQRQPGESLSDVAYRLLDKVA